MDELRSHNVFDEQPTLTEEFRKAGKAAHSFSDALVNSKIIFVFTDRALYGRAISCFLFIFEALEELIPNEMLEKPDLKPLPELLLGSGISRTRAFYEDLEYYLGPNWREAAAPTTAVQNYVRYLRENGPRNPTILLAHAYTQYMAMLSGGVLISRMARRQMALPPGLGTHCFEFKTSSPSELKARFKQTVDDLGAKLSVEERKQLIQEHLLVYKFNNAIISSFRIGAWPLLRGAARLLPTSVRYALVALLLAGGVTWLLGGYTART